MKHTKTFNFFAKKHRMITYLILIVLMSMISTLVMKNATRQQMDERLELKLNNTMEQMVHEINLEYERNMINLKYTSLDNSIRYSLFLDLFFQLETTCKHIMEQGNLSNLIVVDDSGVVTYSSIPMFSRGRQFPLKIGEDSTTGKYYYEDIYEYSYYPVTVDRQLVGGIFTFCNLLNFSKIIDHYLEDKELRLTYELWEFESEDQFLFYQNQGMQSVKARYLDFRRKKITAQAWLSQEGKEYLEMNVPGEKDKDEPFIFLSISDRDYGRLRTEAMKQGMKYSAYLTVLFIFTLLALDKILRISVYRNVKMKVTLDNLRMQKHEFLRHINIVNGLLQHNETDKLKHYLDSVTANVSYLYEISKLVNPTIEILIKEKEVECQKQDIFFNFKTNTKLEDIRFEDYDLCTILGNLIDNSIEAVLKRESFRKIDVEINNQMGIYIFIISNNGPIISRKEMNKIFKRGYTTKAIRKGHGIGLSIVKKTVQKYHGNMEVESSNSRTVFTVCLPE